MSATEEQVRREQEQWEQGENDDETTVEALADGEEIEETPPLQSPLEGFAESITMTPGGDKAKSSSITMRGGKLPVSGEYKKGDVVELYVRCRVAEIHFVDTVDKFGEVTGTERKHVAKPIAVRRLSVTEE
jgi:hypothetical protein